MTDYQEEAIDFLDRANAKMYITFIKRAVNPDWNDNAIRNLYRVRITTPCGTMGFNFWDSVYNTEASKTTLDAYCNSHFGAKYSELPIDKKIEATAGFTDLQDKSRPSEYDILATMEKYDYGTLEDFCHEFGYNYWEDKKRVRSVYNACCKQYDGLKRVFTPKQLEELREIN